MAQQSLASFMDSLGAVDKKPFTPSPHICVEADTLTMYFENTASYAERIDNFLTIFKSFNNEDVVGFELKGIKRKMQELGAMICVVHAQTPKIKVQIRLILLEYMSKAEHKEPYEELLKKSEGVDAPVPVGN